MSKRIKQWYRFRMREDRTGKVKYKGYIQLENIRQFSVKDLVEALDSLEWELAEHFNASMNN